jgi:hypothetical protein
MPVVLRVTLSHLQSHGNNIYSLQAIYRPVVLVLTNLQKTSPDLGKLYPSFITLANSGPIHVGIACNSASARAVAGVSP